MRKTQLLSLSVLSLALLPALSVQAASQINFTQQATAADTASVAGESRQPTATASPAAARRPGTTAAIKAEQFTGPTGQKTRIIGANGWSFPLVTAWHRRQRQADRSGK